jgi:hypothetical protein
MSNVQRISSWVKAHIHTNGLVIQSRFKSCGIGGIMNESTSREIGKKARSFHASMLA